MVKCKRCCERDESTTKQTTFLEHILLKKRHLSFAGARSGKTENFTVINQGKHKVKQIYFWNLMTTVFTM